MGDSGSVQLARLVDGENPEAVMAEARRIFLFWYDAEAGMKSRQSRSI